MMREDENGVDYLQGNTAPTSGALSSGMTSVGTLIRDWRHRRHLSQLELAGDAEISTRHLSFIETGRATPSRDMVLRLAERLDVPLRARNTLLVSAGFAPLYSERPLNDPALHVAMTAIEHLLRAHAPFPALAIDRHWNLVTANDTARGLMTDVDGSLVTPPINVLRLSLHPHGLAARIVNLGEWKAHVLTRLRRQVDVSGDAELEGLAAELSAYPAPPAPRDSRAGAEMAGVVIPFKLRTASGVLSFLTTTTIFGTPVDVTLSEIALESFFPADEATAAALGSRD
jgi:transcriptional regulator with XRE-family HTH domain